MLSLKTAVDQVRETVENVRQYVVNNPIVVGAGVGVAAAVSATSYLVRGQTQKPIQPSFDLNNQTVTVNGKPEHRASRQANPPDYYDFDRTFPDVNTIYQCLLRGKELSNNGPCYGSRSGPNKEYVWLSYQEVIDKAQQFGSGLIAKGIKPVNDTRVGIYAKNCIQWAIADFGCQAYAMCPVAIYDTNTLEAVSHIARLCEMEAVLVDNNKRLQDLLKIKEDIETLRLIIVAQQPTEDLEAEACKLGVELLHFDQILELGKQNLKEAPGPSTEDLYTICFTSGTTGDPKGAMVSHEGFMRMIDAGTTFCKDHVKFSPNDVYISYLPLAHNFERAGNSIVLCNGGRIGFFRGDIRALMDDIKELKPTIFFTVPRLLNRIYDTVQAQVKGSWIKSTMLKWALDSKQKEMERGILRTDSFWDKIMFKKIQEKLGGRIQLLLCSSAPLSNEVLQFVRCALGCWVLEAYGQTEASAGISCTAVGDTALGSVGAPWPGVHLKLEDVPEMEYFAKDLKGELCVKSATIMKGYFKEPKLTAETIDSDGWLHTGDIATFLPNGALKIIDRKKNIFKLAQGEFIAVEKIENAYRESPYVAQIFLDGSSTKPCLMGVIVPDEEYIAKWAPSQGIPADLKSFCKYPGVKDLVLKDLIEQGKKSGLKGYEQVKDIILESTPFTIESQLLTPTLKNKRPKLKAKYQEQISALYEKHGL